MALLSAGVEITEIDASPIVPTVSNSIGVFGGDFVKGQVGAYRLMTTVDDLITFYGKPTNTNYNDWYQAYNFLQYGNKLYVARAANTNGTATPATAVVGLNTSLTNVIPVNITAEFTVGDYVTFGTDTEVYQITSIVADTSITLDRNVEVAIVVATDDSINIWTQAMNAVFEAVDTVAGAEAVASNDGYVASMMVIENDEDFEQKEPSIAFANAADSKLKIIARNPGAWGNNIEVAIATPDVFGTATPSLAFDGIGVDELFEYAPTGTEVGILVKDGDFIVETFVVDFDVDAKDHNNKSTYVETVINSNSSYIFVKDNTANTDAIKPYIFENDGVAGTVISLVNGEDSAVGLDDLLTAYELFDNKEYLDVDIIIGNETDSGAAAKALVTTRKDCIAFIGANYGDVVGKKAAVAVSNLVAWRKTGSLNYNDMFTVACANYKYIYDRYNDKNRWVNIAGDIAGLRAQTSTNRASWWASAGLERGQVKNVIKLAFNPNNGQRDLLYKNGLNPIVAFPGQGTVMWGQKTLLDKPSSFDRVNVRGLFNTMERALGKMAKYQIMEFNDNFTRNRIVSMIKPYLASVKAGRGIQDFLVICDETNNTADVISRNNLVVDIYIKPTYVAEFIQLRFTNAGTNSFSEVIGG